MTSVFFNISYFQLKLLILTVTFLIIAGTNFPSLDITIQPKRGTALLWPSVLNAEPMAKDGRTQHQALDVKKGIKYAANGWIHMYDYITPQKRGCS